MHSSKENGVSFESNLSPFERQSTPFCINKVPNGKNTNEKIYSSLNIFNIVFSEIVIFFIKLRNALDKTSYLLPYS